MPASVTCAENPGEPAHALSRTKAASAGADHREPRTRAWTPRAARASTFQVGRVRRRVRTFTLEDLCTETRDASLAYTPSLRTSSSTRTVGFKHGLSDEEATIDGNIWVAYEDKSKERVEGVRLLPNSDD